MKYILQGSDLDDIRSKIDEAGLEEVQDSPDVVITYGGDGSLVGAERDFPGIPKVPIRSSSICEKCSKHSTNEILKRLCNDELKKSQFMKVEVNFGKNRKIALNEVGIHMRNPASAVRFRLLVNDKPHVQGEIIGDGLVVSTPFGSTAYFRSITRGTFRSGLGLAIMNSVIPIEWAILKETDQVGVEITRGPAIVLADNDPEQWRLEVGDKISFRAADESANIWGFDALTCGDCKLSQPRPPR